MKEQVKGCGCKREEEEEGCWRHIGNGVKCYKNGDATMQVVEQGIRLGLGRRRGKQGEERKEFEDDGGVVEETMSG